MTACRDHPCRQESLTLSYQGKSSDVSSKRSQISAATRIWPCLSFHLPVSAPCHRDTMDWKHSGGESIEVCAERVCLLSGKAHTTWGTCKGFSQERKIQSNEEHRNTNVAAMTYGRSIHGWEQKKASMGASRGQGSPKCLI